MYKPFVFFLAIFIATLISSPAFCDILFKDDCEDQPNPNDWTLQLTGNSGSSFSVSTEEARGGKSSYKYVLTPGTYLRVEHVLGNSELFPFQYDTEYWMGWSVFIPFESSYQSVAMGQFHGTPDKPIGICDEYRNPIWAISPDKLEGTFVSMKAQSSYCGGSPRQYIREPWYDLPDHPFVKGYWNDVVLNFKFSYSQHGFFNVWLNNESVVTDVGANCFNDSFGPYFKIGLYGDITETMIVYFDEIRIGDASSSYDEIAPKGNNNEVKRPAAPTSLRILLSRFGVGPRQYIERRVKTAYKGPQTGLRTYISHHTKIKFKTNAARPQ